MASNAIEAGKAIVRVELKDSTDAGIRQLQSKLKTLSKDIGEVGRSITKIGAAITASFGSALAALAIPVQVASQIESVTAAFTALTGSVGKAVQTVDKLRKFAAATPFGFQGLTKATQVLLAYDIATEDAVDDMKRLAEVAQGQQERLDRLALAFGQVAAKGRLFATEVRQFTESGFNPLAQISKDTGKSMRQLEKDMQNGLISFSQVRKAMITVTSEGGRFHGSLALLSKTFAGLWINMTDNIKIAVEPIGKALLPAMKDLFSRVIELTGHIRSWGENNQDLILTLAQMAVIGTAVGGVITGVGVALVATAAAMATFNTLIDGALKIKRFLSVAGDTSKVQSSLSAAAKEANALGAAVITSSREASLAVSSIGHAVLRVERIAKTAFGSISKSAVKMSAIVTTAVESIGVSSKKAVSQLGTVAAGMVAIEAKMTKSMASIGVAAAAMVTTTTTAVGSSVAELAAYAATLQGITAQIASSSVGTSVVAANAKKTAKVLKTSASSAVGTATKAMAKAAKKAPGKKGVLDLAAMFTPDNPISMDLNKLVDIGESNLSGELAKEADEIAAVLGSLGLRLKTEVKGSQSLDILMSEITQSIKTGKDSAGREIGALNQLLGQGILAGSAAIPNDLFKGAELAGDTIDQLVSNAEKNAKSITAAQPVSSYISGLLKAAESEADDAAGQIAAKVAKTASASDFFDELFAPQSGKQKYASMYLDYAEAALDAPVKTAAKTAKEASAKFATEFGDEMVDVMDSLRIRPPKFVSSIADATKKSPQTIKRSFVNVFGDISAGAKSTFSGIANVATKSATTVGAAAATPFRLMAVPIGKVTGLVGTLAGKLGGLARLLVVPFTATLGPVLGVVAGIIAAVAAIGFLLNKAGLLKPMFEFITSTVKRFFALVSKVFGGIRQALALGEISTAFKVLWLGIKVQVLRAGDFLIKHIPAMFAGAFDVAWKLVKAAGQTIVDIVVAIPELIRAAFSGAKSIGEIIMDIFTGNFESNAAGRFLEQAEKDLESELAGLQSRTDKAKKEREKEQGISKATPEDTAAQLAVADRAIVEEELKRQQDDANEAATQRIEKIKEEINELKYGKEAAEKIASANEHVTDQRKKEISVLEAQKKALEVSKGVQDRIKALKDETKELLIGKESFERYEFAMKGATKAQLAMLWAAQSSNVFQETMKGLRDEIESVGRSAEQIELDKLRDTGVLTNDQLSLIKAEQDRLVALKAEEAALEALSTEAKKIKEDLKSPLDKFREDQKQIIEMQEKGLLTQGEAAQAYRNNIQDLVQQITQVNRSKLKGLEVGSDEAAEAREAARQQLLRIAAQRRGQAIAQQVAANKVQQATKTTAGASEHEKRLEDLGDRQLRALDFIARKKEVEVEIR